MARDPANKPAPSPKHKPSAKHTLHEVLNSLQDVLENELAEDGGTQKPVPTDHAVSAAPNVLHARRRDEVLSSLKTLIGAAAEGRPLPGAPAPSLPEEPPARADGAPPLEDIAPEGAAPPPPEAPPDPDPVVGTDEFRLEMEDPVAPAAEEQEQVEPRASTETSADPEAEAPTPRRSRRRRTRPKQMEIGWDDIPILNDIVQPAPELPDIEVTPEIRDIAIQVAAALNIELKRAGKETLDVKLVMQLQTLLQRELARRGLLLQEDEPGKEPDADR